jgi:DNA invertase Pin-like site-specific DNA recombinase
VPFDGKAALRKPLDHVYARRIDVIVLYKVDRLTRALAEFAKLSSWSTRSIRPAAAALLCGRAFRRV